MSDVSVLCVWGSLDGEWIGWAGDEYRPAEREKYRFRWWEIGGRSIPVYILAGVIDGKPPEFHPDTKLKIREHLAAREADRA